MRCDWFFKHPLLKIRITNQDTFVNACKKELSKLNNIYAGKSIIMLKFAKSG
ncbi:hypothetical protein ANACOL_01664 [Anaerotruncus colihominis DSM 17241]|uniref:Uncharacterized protein n=1 Tax=Anaerotruncus colihominis DSM 17241 TaxID=445972 RepID=B0PA95_9FIRM|nr:hypothetical protein ANACOL_01664 [Anaerotruncus colihominis DSM 17241]